MLSIVDVARIILHEKQYLTTMKLQKLAYYSQVYSLVNFKKPLFQEHFEPWVNGPVSPDLYQLHRGCFMLEDGELGSMSISFLDLEKSDLISIQSVLERLGDMSGAELSELTNNEEPWLKHRKGVSSLERSNEGITFDDILSCYSDPEIQKSHPLFCNF